jgi:hypothetical protein
MAKKRNAELAQHNFILSKSFPVIRFEMIFSLQTLCFLAAVGSQEAEQRAVNVRNRDDAGTKARGEVISLETVVEKMVALKNERRLENKL